MKDQDSVCKMQSVADTSKKHLYCSHLCKKLAIWPSASKYALLFE